MPASASDLDRDGMLPAALLCCLVRELGTEAAFRRAALEEDEEYSRRASRCRWWGRPAVKESGAPFGAFHQLDTAAAAADDAAMAPLLTPRGVDV